jgi:hypothetical protein
MSISFGDTRIHTHTASPHAHSLSHTHSLTHTHSLSLTHTLTLSHTHKAPPGSAIYRALEAACLLDNERNERLTEDEEQASGILRPTLTVCLGFFFFSESFFFFESL